MLCDRCSIAISDILTCNLDSSRWEAEPVDPYPASRFFYLGNLTKISENSSRRICFVCKVAHDYVSNPSRAKFEPPDKGESKGYYFSVPVKYATSDPPQPWTITIKELMFDQKTEKLRSYFRIPFELYLCGASSDQLSGNNQPYQLGITVSRDLYNRLGTHMNHHSGSEDSIGLAMNWSTNCARFHTQCSRRKQEYRLPTRVIDVGPGSNESSDFQDLRLILTNGLHGHYASLSHRWSSITNQFCTTQNNFQQHMKHISFGQLPRTFRDSVILCRQLGIRYLWIDCLCIIQDDDKDWQKECENMSDIFENSYLTIFALRARDGDEGLFHLREEKNRRIYLQIKDGPLLGLRRREFGLEEDVRVSSTGSRGWILQEKILSPAILHFGNRQMHWECKNATISEIRANIQIPASGPLKNVLHEAQRQGCHLYPQGHFIAWNMIMQRYSRMDLTHEYDRLPAILGLAQRFQQSFRATFVAGLWLEDLHRGLLWNSHFSKMDKTSTSQQSDQDHELKHPKVPAKRTTAPSWSWIPIAGNNNISFEWDVELPQRQSPSIFFPTMRLRSDADAEVVDTTVTSCPDIHRGAVQGTLQLWGIIIKIKILPPNDAFCSSMQRMLPRVNERKQPFQFTVPNHSPASIMDNLKPSEIFCIPDSDLLEPIECHCLIIADWRFEDSFKGYFDKPVSYSSPELRCFLVLRRSRPRRKHHHPLDYGVFERIGMGAGNISAVDRFFGPSHEKKFVTIV